MRIGYIVMALGMAFACIEALNNNFIIEPIIIFFIGLVLSIISYYIMPYTLDDLNKKVK